jgi:hypothetical protein
MSIPLQQLGLEKRWPGLAELQSEVVNLTRQVEKAGGEARALEAQLQQAKHKDLDREASAVRSGRKAPAPTEEPKVQKQLEAAQRNGLVLSRALEAAQMDLGVLRAKYQGELYEDVVEARAKVAKSLAGHAKRALADFSRWSDLHYTVKDLMPVVPLDENRPAERSTLVPAVQVVTSPGPDRGRVEQMLSYLVSLAPTEEEGKEEATDAA